MACRREDVGHVTFTGAGAQEIPVSLPRETKLAFETAYEVDLPSGEADVNHEWSYTFEAVQGGRVTRSTTCDALDPAVGLSASQRDTHFRTSRGRLVACGLTVPAGELTLRIRFAPAGPQTRVTPVKVELYVMR